MKIKTFILILLCFQVLHSQKEASNWFFGEYAGVTFNSGTPQALIGELTTREGCASISDSNGNLLFYTDGSTVYTREHLVMPNGTGLLGNNSSTQSAIIVPKPGSRTNYYIFTVDSAEKLTPNAINHGLNFSEVDMNLNNGYGAVVASNKNRHLITYDPSDELQEEWKCSEKLAAIIDSEQTGYWVLTHFVNSFYAFKIDENGVNEQAVISTTSETVPIVNVQRPGDVLANISAIGYLKIAPNGENIAVVHSSTANSPTSGRAYLYDFDDQTGVVSNNARSMIGGTYPYGIEFSSRSNKLYLSANNYIIRRGQTTFTGSSLYQFDLRTGNVAGSRTEINNSFNHHAGALQLGIDGKIYRAKYDVVSGSGLSHLGVIDKPELDGSSCEYKDIGVDLLSRTYSQYGLPPFIASTFLLSFQYEFTCFGDLTHFTISTEEDFDSVLWDFGDGNTSSEIEPWHTYQNPGTYNVSLVTVHDGLASDPISKTIEIDDPPSASEEAVELFECDLFDDDPEDGLTTFNLSLANAEVSLGAENVIIHYFTDLDRLHGDRFNAEALPGLYNNSDRDELVFAKISRLNSDCYSVGRVVLRTNPSGQFLAEPITSCDDGNNMGLFSLEEYKSQMIAQMGLPSAAEITFHMSEEEASYGSNPLEGPYHGAATTLFFRIQSDNRCFGVGPVELKIYELPWINTKSDYTFCEASFPVEIDAGVDQGARNSYTYLWGNGQETHQISISEPGTYTVSISDAVTACSTTKTIHVEGIATPVIQDIEITEEFGLYNVDVKVAAADPSPMFSLDEEYGSYQPEGMFQSLNPGTYTVFVKDPFNCSTVSRQFYLFGFPKFLTPNHDGQNDQWSVQGLNARAFTYSRIHIFNRHGKLLATLGPGDQWDGTYMGVALPSDDYWYKMTLTDVKNNTTTYSGHFSLIRK